MKEFEKWWEDANRKPLPSDEFETFKMVWRAARKAALECIRDKMLTSSEVDIMEIYGFIKDELSEE